MKQTNKQKTEEDDCKESCGEDRNEKKLENERKGKKRRVRKSQERRDGFIILKVITSLRQLRPLQTFLLRLMHVYGRQESIPCNVTRNYAIVNGGRGVIKANPSAEERPEQ